MDQEQRGRYGREAAYPMAGTPKRPWSERCRALAEHAVFRHTVLGLETSRPFSEGLSSQFAAFHAIVGLSCSRQS